MVKIYKMLDLDKTISSAFILSSLATWVKKTNPAFMEKMSLGR